MFSFDLQLFGPSNNAQQQNQAANQQVKTNTKQALQNFAAWLQGNPGPLAGMNAPRPPGQLPGGPVGGSGAGFGGLGGSQVTQGVRPPAPVQPNLAAMPGGFSGAPMQRATPGIVDVSNGAPHMPTGAPGPQPQVNPQIAAILRQRGLM